MTLDGVQRQTWASLGSSVGILQFSWTAKRHLRASLVRESGPWVLPGRILPSRDGHRASGLLY